MQQQHLESTCIKLGYVTTNFGQIYGYQFNPEKSLMAIKQKYGKSRVKNLKPLNLRCLLTNQSADFTIRKISNVPHLISQDNASTSGFAPVKLSAIP